MDERQFGWHLEQQGINPPPIPTINKILRG